MTSIWSPAGELPTARALFGHGEGAVLLTDGTVLVAGGTDGRRTTVPGAVLFDPAGDTWTPTGAPATSRRNHTTTRLPDGRVLAAGGETGPLVFPFNGLATAEVYDPGNRTWSPTGSMSFARWAHTATLLPDGKVLVAGGGTARAAQSYQSLRTAELYDPITGRWSRTGDMTDARLAHAAVLLADGRVLVVGGGLGTGRGEYASLAFCELYDPATGTWTPTGTLAMPRISHEASMLPDGSVFVTGGWPSIMPVGWNHQAYSLWTTERYDPATGAWSPDANMPGGRAMHRAALLRSGQLLVVGGTEAANPDAGYPSATVYDPILRSWSPAPSMSAGRFGFALVTLADGRALAISGVETASMATPEPGDDTLTPAAEVFGVAQPPRPPADEELDAWEREAEEWSRKATEHYENRRYPDAVECQQRALELFTKVRRRRPAYTSRWAQCSLFLGVFLQATGRHDGAIRSCVDAVEAHRSIDDKPQTAWAYGNLATIYSRAGRAAEAVTRNSGRVRCTRSSPVATRRIASCGPTRRSSSRSTCPPSAGTTMQSP